jgi:hypothetical protein
VCVCVCVCERERGRKGGMSGLDDFVGTEIPGPRPRQRNMGPSQARPQVGRGQWGPRFVGGAITIRNVQTAFDVHARQ